VVEADLGDRIASAGHHPRKISGRLKTIFDTFQDAALTREADRAR
jgi:hypothetical protein